MKTVLTIGERLTDERKNRGWTTAQAVAEIEMRYGFSLSTGKLNEMEQDKDKDFGYIAFVYLAKLYDVSVDYLLGLTEVKPIDNKLQAAAEITGLSPDVISFLKYTRDSNAETWRLDVINKIFESSHFKKIIYYLTNSITRDSQNIEYDVYETNTVEMGETLATKEFYLLVDELREKFKDRIEQDDRTLYAILKQLYSDGKITDLQYEQTKSEFEKGNYNYNPKSN